MKVLAFHPGNVNDYSDPNNVRNCYLVGLTDLYGASDYVRNTQAEYLNRLVEIGVAGFRIDASKHMWPNVSFSTKSPSMFTLIRCSSSSEYQELHAV